MLFKENYLKMRHFLVQGNYLLVQGRVEGRYNDENNLSVNTKEIILLSEAMEKLAKAVVVSIDPKQLTTEQADFLFDAAHNNPGNAELAFEIREPETGKLLKLSSGTGRVNVGKFLNAVNENGEIKIKVVL